LDGAESSSSITPIAQFQHDARQLPVRRHRAKQYSGRFIRSIDVKTASVETPSALLNIRG
jgi:hypothetical protein